MSKDTKIRLALAVIVFMSLQAVVFGFGMVAVLYYPNWSGQDLFFWVPLVIGLSSIISAALSWWIAPQLRARYWRQQEAGQGGSHIGSPAR